MSPAPRIAVVVLAAALGARAGGAEERRFQIEAGGGAALGTLAWARTSSWELHAEAATLQAEHEAGAGPALEAGLGFRLSSRFGLRAAFTWSRRDTEATVRALLPHPFFFERPRALEARVAALEYRQWSSHLDLQWRPLLGQTEVTVFAGVCLARAEADLVERVEIDEEYPFDAVGFRSAVTQRVRSDVGIGWSAGATLSHALGGRLVLAVQGRYTRADVELSSPEPTSLAADGLRLTASLALRF